jgi:hypothetical protein
MDFEVGFTELCNCLRSYKEGGLDASNFNSAMKRKVENFVRLGEWQVDPTGLVDKLVPNQEHLLQIVTPQEYNVIILIVLNTNPIVRMPPDIPFSMFRNGRAANMTSGHPGNMASNMPMFPGFATGVTANRPEMLWPWVSNPPGNGSINPSGNGSLSAASALMNLGGPAPTLETPHNARQIQHGQELRSPVHLPPMRNVIVPSNATRGSQSVISSEISNRTTTTTKGRCIDTNRCVPPGEIDLLWREFFHTFGGCKSLSAPKTFKQRQCRVDGCNR